MGCCASISRYPSNMTSHLLRDKPLTLAAALAGRRRLGRFSRWPWLAVLGLGILGLSLIFNQSGNQFGKTLAAPGIKEAKAAVPVFRGDCRAAPAPLQRELTAISRSFNGKVGIAVAKAGCNWMAGDRFNEFFPQQSVSKLWVSLAVLDAVDSRRIGLDDQLVIRPNDLTVFNQPLRWEVLEKGAIARPVHSLMSDALSHSDNTANDRLLWTVGGPEKVRAMFRHKGIEGIRFGPGERLLQSQIAGLEWTQELSLGSNFNQARARLPLDERKAALDRYMTNPMDGAMPSGIALALARLASGQLLSPGSTAVMMEILGKTHSGPMRLKAGAPMGWKVYHKTGTGQELGGLATGYNDVGILQAPDGAYYTVAVMIGQTTEPIPVRMQLMQAVSKAVAQFHRAEPY